MHLVSLTAVLAGCDTFFSLRHIEVDARGTDATTLDPVVSEGLIVWLPLDGIEEGAAADLTGKGHSAACVGPCPTSTPGPMGTGLQFDGSQVLRIADDADLHLASTGFTVSAWVRFDDETPVMDNCPFSQLRDDGDYNTWQACAAPNHQFVFYSWTGAAHSAFGELLPINTWVFLAISWDPMTSQQRLYVDGMTWRETTPKIAWTDTGAIIVGGDLADAAALDAPLVGAMDDVRIYARALSNGELDQLRALGTP